MKRKGLKQQNGYSLVEMLIVIVIVGILAVFAVSQLGAANNQVSRENVSKRLKVYLERARFDSVKRRPGTLAQRARVVINDTSSFTLLTDLNQNGILETAETSPTDLSGNSIRIQDPGWNFPLTISFDQNGYITATDNLNNPITPNFVICDSNCSDPTLTASNSDQVSISPTGTVLLLNGGESVPTYSSPTVTAVTPTDEVDPMVSVQ